MPIIRILNAVIVRWQNFIMRTEKFYIRLKRNAYDLIGCLGWFDGKIN